MAFQVLELRFLLDLLLQLVQLKHLVEVVFLVQNHVGALDMHLGPGGIARFKQVEVGVLIVLQVHIYRVDEFPLYGLVSFCFNRSCQLLCLLNKVHHRCRHCINKRPCLAS